MVGSSSRCLPSPIKVLTTVRVVWPSPLQTTNANMNAFLVKWLTFNSIIPKRSTKKNRSTWRWLCRIAPSQAPPAHHWRSTGRWMGAQPKNPAECVRRRAHCQANSAPRVSAVNEAHAAPCAPIRVPPLKPSTHMASNRTLVDAISKASRRMGLVWPDQSNRPPRPSRQKRG